MNPAVVSLLLGIILCAVGAQAERCKEKCGRCPPIMAKCSATTLEPDCHNDCNCLGKKKCCPLCGMRCMDPIEG